MNLQKENEINLDKDDVIRISEEYIATADANNTAQNHQNNTTDKITVNVWELPSEPIPPAPNIDYTQFNNNNRSILPDIMRNIPILPLAIIGGSIVAVLFFVAVFALVANPDRNKIAIDNSSETNIQTDNSSKEKKPAQKLKEFPSELRVVAKYLGDGLHTSYEAAAKQMNAEDLMVYLHTWDIELHKISSKNPDINYLISEATKNFDEMKNIKEVYDSLPKPDGWGQLKVFGTSFLDGFLLGSGLPPTGKSISTYTQERDKEIAVQNTVEAMSKALEKHYGICRLLPKVAQNFSAKVTKNNRFTVDFFEPPSTTVSDSLTIYNGGQDLHNCTLEVKIIGEDANVVTNVFFVEEWKRNTWLYALSNISFITTTKVERLEVTILSPEYSTTIEYNYNQKERDKDYAAFLKDVRLIAVGYRFRKEGVFKDWETLIQLCMTGANLANCKLVVTFKNGNQNYSCAVDYTSWDHNTNAIVKPGNNNLTFKPNKIIAEIRFPRSSIVVQETFDVQNIPEYHW
ncbi:MAG: hypothetical protein LBP59_17820 [Planctomycetaceae bacterium]|jgi:hypothetical protein|nr:hypothetical protein [Planctomycetaceae bacterium]